MGEPWTIFSDREPRKTRATGPIELEPTVRAFPRERHRTEYRLSRKALLRAGGARVLLARERSSAANRASGLPSLLERGLFALLDPTRRVTFGSSASSP
jgi:hypothetical protein